ncbi:hypothetical protein GOODEAATRI_003233 [Goodea atripinnis]|uniref:Protein UNC80 C-terminal domain-containing protein n=1 Tax=Goodea atripinnis TaxID=208336 RepID=A0ABV0PKH2_9TELE
MGVVGPSSVADGLPLLHLSPYLSPPLPFSTAVVRLVALQIQALKDDFPLSHVISPFTNQERREGMLLNLLIPFVLTVGSGSKDSPHLEQPEIFLLLQTVINILLPPRIISTSRTKNFMLDASPAHCSTPGDTGKDLRREGLAESTSQAAYLAYQGKTSISTVGTSTSAYRLSLATMSRSNTGTGTVWEQDSQPVMSQRRFSSHVTGSATSQPENPRTTMLPSQRFCDAPCCPFQRLNREGVRELDSPQLEGASSLKTNPWVTTRSLPTVCFLLDDTTKAGQISLFSLLPLAPSSIRESPGDEDTTALLPRGDALLQLNEDDGTENPLLAPLLSPVSARRSPRRSPLPLSPVDLDLDESHV